jgi:TRAP-type C4-dicarboxylate transport system permease large subunit
LGSEARSRADIALATATEVSTIGIVYAFVVGFLIYGLLIYRSFDWRRIMPMLIDTACLSGAILLIVGTATGMAWGLTQRGFSRALTARHDRPARRSRGLHRGVDRGLHRLGQCARGHSGDRAVRPRHGVGLFAPPFGVGYYAACAIGRVA